MQLYMENGVLTMGLPNGESHADIPEGVKRIGAGAFCGRRELKSVSLPEGLEEIGGDAFKDTGLSRVTLPPSVVSIGPEAFARCGNLNLIRLPDTVQLCGSRILASCEQLRKIEIYRKDGMTCDFPMGESPEYEADVLRILLAKDFEYPVSYGYLCRMLCRMVSGGLDTGEAENYLLDNAGTVFDWLLVNGYTELIQQLPESVLKLLPHRVRRKLPFRITEGLFPKLQRKLKAVGNPFVIRNGVLIRYADRMALSVSIPDSVTAIGGGAFEGCKLLKHVVFPDGLTAVGKRAFRNCAALEDVVPAYQSMRKGVAFPEGVTVIGERAFENCGSLRLAALPESIQVIGTRAFAGCRKLESFRVSDTVPHLGDDILDETYVLDHVVICRKDGGMFGVPTEHFRDSVDEEVVRTRLQMSFYDFDEGGNDKGFTMFSSTVVYDILPMLLKRDFTIRMPEHTWVRLVCRMVAEDYDNGETGAYMLSHPDIFCRLLIDEEDRKALAFLLDSEQRGVPPISEILDMLLVHANQKQNFDMQLLLMNAAPKQQGFAEMQQRFQI